MMSKVRKYANITVYTNQKLRSIAKKVAVNYCEISLPCFLQIMVKTRNNL